MTDLNKAIKLAEAASEQLQKSHVKATSFTNAKGTVVNRAEHEDSRQKKTAPPQADSNRHEWDDLHDDHNPKYALSSISSKSLGQAAKGKIDLQKKAKEELAARGVDEHGKWLGFDKAKKHHGVTTDHMGGDAPDHDDVMGNFQTLHHKVLGAIAAGHTDPKRLAREELTNRGHDHDGNWIGFDKAAKLHKIVIEKAPTRSNVEKYLAKFGDKMAGADKLEVKGWVEGIGGMTAGDKKDLYSAIIKKYYKPRAGKA